MLKMVMFYETLGLHAGGKGEELGLKKITWNFSSTEVVKNLTLRKDFHT